MIFKYQNLNIYYEEYGCGEKILIFLHGWGNSCQSFTKQIEYFKDKYHLYLIDMPGFGKSSEPPKPYSLNDYIEVLENFIIDKQINCPILVGHSFGGRIAIKYASSKKISHLILIASAGLKKKRRTKTRFKILKYKIKKKWYQITKNYALYNYLIKNSGSSDYQNASSILKKTMIKVINEDLSKQLKKINVKTLLIWGQQDTETPIEQGEKMKKMIKGAALVVFKKGTHFVHQENEKEINKIIEDFVSDNK